MTITWRPLTQWPPARKRTPAIERKAARFQSGTRYGQTDEGYRPIARGERIGLDRTLRDLERELSAIGARDVVVQVDITDDRELRRDGVVRVNAYTKTPAVVLTLKRDGVPYVFACDHFNRWDDNLRAIALGLEALRKLERYEIAQTGDQYRGWQALPASTTPALNVEQAARAVLSRANMGPSVMVGGVLQVVSTARDAIRRAQAATHPDAGGSTGDFQLVQEAKRVLEAHFGTTL